MFLSATAKNLMLQAMDAAQSGGMKFGSLHSAYSNTGANEIIGSVYTRIALAWGAAASGVKSLVATLPTWNVPPSTSVLWVGSWDSAGTSEVQSLVDTGATAGTFTLTFGGQTTAAIAYNAAASAVASALNALSSIVAIGGVTCTGGPLPTAVTITFQPTVGGQTLITANSGGLTGGTATITRTTAGALGNFLGMMPAGGGTLHRFAVNATDVTNGTIDCPAHGFVANQPVVVWGASLPGPLAVGTVYYVLASGLTADVLKLSLTQGGAAITLTTTGTGNMQAINPEVFGSAGTFSLNSGSIDLNTVQ